MYNAERHWVDNWHQFLDLKIFLALCSSYKLSDAELWKTNLNDRVDCDAFVAASLLQTKVEGKPETTVSFVHMLS